MKILRTRTESKELLTFRYLNPRMTLSQREKNHYLHLEKGYQGEVLFDQLTEKLQNNLYIINDLCLEYNNSSFQIDSLIISQETLYPFEVKNIEGDYFYEKEGFHSVLTNDEIKNPLAQIKRTNSLFVPLLKRLQIFSPVEGSVTFVNPQFTLYQAPKDAPIVYPTQLPNLMKKLNQIPSRLNDQHKKLAEQLIAMHIPESPYVWKPSYKYEQLRKNPFCGLCYSSMFFAGNGKLVCSKCRCEETLDTGVLRSVNELMLLFPEMRITTNRIHDWCGGIVSRKVIRGILKANFEKAGYGRWFYFE